MKLFLRLAIFPMLLSDKAIDLVETLRKGAGVSENIR